MTTNRLANSLIKAMNSQDRMICEKHVDSEVIFYCKTCEEPLCTDAIVEDSQHRLHESFKLGKVYEEANQRIGILMEHYSDLKSDCQQEIAKYQKIL